MKVTINTDGSVSFDVESAADALALARELQNGSVAAPKSAPPAPVAEVKTADAPAKPEPAPKAPRTNEKRTNQELLTAARGVGISVALYVVWEYLLQHEGDRSGVSLAEVSRHFHITGAAAGQRLLELRRRGFVERIKRSRYRATMPASDGS